MKYENLHFTWGIRVLRPVKMAFMHLFRKIGGNKIFFLVLIFFEGDFMAVSGYYKKGKSSSGIQ